MDAVTTIRLNSKRVPMKSVKQLNGVPLLNYALETMLAVEEVKRVIVYTHDDLAEYMQSEVASEVQVIKRPKWMDGDDVTFNQIMDKAINHIKGDYLLFFTVTAPFVRSASISKMIRAVLYGDYDSAFLAKALKGFCWFEGHPLNYDLNAVPKTQNLKPVLAETSSHYLFSKRMYIETGRRVGNKPFIKVIDPIEGLDIDDPADFFMAECLAGSIHRL